MTVGVLALQGAFGLHVDLLESLGVRAVEVRRADQLDSVDRLVLPDDSLMESFLEHDQLGSLGFQHPGDWDSGPCTDDFRDFVLGDLFTQ